MYALNYHLYYLWLLVTVQTENLIEKMQYSSLVKDEIAAH